jgi:hypothetical protein
MKTAETSGADAMNNREDHLPTHNNSTDAVIIRVATASDGLAIERLAELDSSVVPSGMTLIGELRQRPVVAVSLDTGQAVADPFVFTLDLLELVQMRAGQLNSRSRSRPLEQALSRVRGRVRKARATSRAGSGHERAPAAPAASA